MLIHSLHSFKILLSDLCRLDMVIEIEWKKTDLILNLLRLIVNRHGCKKVHGNPKEGSCSK